MARLSRRKVVACMGAVPLLASGACAGVAETDPVLVLCAHYADLTGRQEALMRQWDEREAWLARNRAWFSLSNAEQRALPEAQMLRTIDEEYDRCVRESARVMRRIRSIQAAPLEGAAAKLSVVAHDIDPEDYPSAHRILLSVITDLRAFPKNE